MKYIRFVLLGAVVFIIVVIAFSFIFPSHVRISRAVNMVVFKDPLKYIDDLNEWQKWYPGFGNEVLKDVKKVNGKIVHARTSGIFVQILEVNDSSVHVKMQKSNRPVFNHWKLIRYAHTDTVTLQNYMEFDFKWYPWEKFSSLLLEHTYGQQMEEGLRRLKELSEAVQ